MLGLYILIAILLVLAAFVAVLLIRTAAFKPKNEKRAVPHEEVFDKDAAVSALAELVKCKTVSSYKKEEEDEVEFEKLIGMLPKLYPSVFVTCELKKLEDRALLFRWKGKSVGEPAVLMAHYDVVPVNEDMWEVPAFEAILKDGRV